MAPFYDQFRRVDEEILNALRDEIQTIEKASALLDVGCGTGRYSEVLASDFDLKLIGIDACTAMLQQASVKHSSGIWIQGLAEQVLPLIRPASIGLALLSYSLHYLYGKELFEMIHEAMSSRGRLIIITYLPEVFDTSIYHRFIPGLTQIDKARFPSYETIAAGLERAGFEYSRRDILVKQSIATLEDVEALITKGSLKYCSTLHLVEEEVLSRSLRHMKSELLREVENNPIDVSNIHTLIVAQRSSC